MGQTTPQTINNKVEVLRKIILKLSRLQLISTVSYPTKCLQFNTLQLLFVRKNLCRHPQLIYKKNFLDVIKFITSDTVT